MWTFFIFSDLFWNKSTTQSQTKNGNCIGFYVNCGRLYSIEGEPLRYLGLAMKWKWKM
ncbi:13568_t:CDS:1, partial [Gigaspora rosea]